VSSTVFISDCVALCATFAFATVCAYKLGTYQGWRKGLRKITPHEKASLTFQDGDTLIAAREMRKGKPFFLGTHMRQHSPWEERREL
jgi:hypothetical protein